MQRLRAAQHRSHSFEGDADDVVLGLLSRCAAARSLRMKAKLPRARVFRPILFAHVPRVDSAGRPKLGNLLEKVDVRVEEEREARRKRINVHSALHTSLNVREAVRKGKGQFLRRGRTGFTNMIARDR